MRTSQTSVSPGGALLLTLASACGDPVALPIVDPAAWTIATEGPFTAGAPSCTPDVTLEAGFVEIVTDDCPWATVSQPLLTDVRQGEPLRLVAFHGPLFAAEPGDGLYAVWIGDTPVWEQVLTIPDDDRLYQPEVPAPADYPAGTPVTWHVHNHGGNDYRLITMTVTTRRAR